MCLEEEEGFLSLLGVPEDLGVNPWRNWYRGVSWKRIGLVKAAGAPKPGGPSLTPALFLWGRRLFLV